MTIQHHPDLAWLIDYTTGALSAGFRTVVGGHLRQCARCRDELRLAERVGATLVDAPPAAQPPRRVTAATSRALAPRPSLTDGNARPASLDGFVAQALHFDWRSLDWRRGTPGLRVARLKDESEEHIWLLHAEPGAVLPEHTHEGAELTLVLRGAYVAAAEQYAVGDIDENDEQVTHQPIVTADGDCLSLLVFEGRLQYHGVIGLAQKVLRF